MEATTVPAVKKVSREAILDAAVEVLRDGGFSAINARSVARKLGCSTQPIYLSFQNMAELKAALTERAIASAFAAACWIWETTSGVGGAASFPAG